MVGASIAGLQARKSASHDNWITSHDDYTISHDDHMTRVVPFFSCWVCVGKESKDRAVLHMSCSTLAGSSWRGEGRWEVTMERTAGARGSHWVQMAVR